ncbi:AI-2E family transporter [Thalassorhabdomicrobium marinisediminis]|uniref:AI-2E family transporter n=1 Tax=Thalassorhabdomicrobium marinisediminis TaxID=2170577 RepID=A0A2T7G198_9RHOB|nr:AI-2E family transporter [Thalassorhabdomicrobium marinisediminis]PVA08192.1 AI-2E family transporter [Thalassorhabdomicrobium marinisediminis]
MSEPQNGIQTEALSKLANLRGIKAMVIGLFILFFVQTLTWASDFLIPVTTAILGYFILNRPRRWLARIGISPTGSAIIFCTIIVVAIGYGLLRLSGPVSTFLADIPEVIRQIEGQLKSAGGNTMEAVNEAVEAADDIINPEDQADDTVEVEVVQKPGIAAMVARIAPMLFGQMAFAIVLLYFLVSSGDMFIRKTVQSIGRFSDKRRAVNVVYDIEDRLGRYLGGITMINAGLGLVVGAAMYVWGLPNYMMVGVMAFLFNFIPFIGAIAGSIIAAILALMTFGDVWPALGVWATYMFLTSFEAQFITPSLISRRMQLNTTVVFLCVAFFAWIWSIMGMIVALPILTVIKIACDEIDGLQRVALFLGDETETEAQADTSPSDK